MCQDVLLVSGALVQDAQDGDDENDGLALVGWDGDGAWFWFRVVAMVVHYFVRHDHQ